MLKTSRRTISGVPRTAVRKRKLAELAARPDAEIDYSDIPPLTEEFWENAVRNPFYRRIVKKRR
jgi:hypothetical protein